MAVFKYYKTFEKDGIADNGTYEDNWIADEDSILKRIHIKDKAGAELKKSTFYFKISERVYTHPYSVASTLGPDVRVTPVLDISFAKGEKLDFTFKNLEGAAKNIYICFEAWSK